MLVYLGPLQAYAACCLLGLQPSTFSEFSETLLKKPSCPHVVTFALGLEADQNATRSLRYRPQVCAKACVAVIPILAWKGAFEMHSVGSIRRCTFSTTSPLDAFPAFRCCS